MLSHCMASLGLLQLSVEVLDNDIKVHKNTASATKRILQASLREQVEHAALPCVTENPLQHYPSAA